MPQQQSPQQFKIHQINSNSMPGMNVVNQHHNQSNFITTSPTPTTAKITPENASQLLATMQPQPPSSLGAHYFKQPSPQKSPQNQQQQIHHHQNNKIMSNQKSLPVVQASTAASTAVIRNSSTNSSSSSFSQFQPPPQQQQTSTNYVVATPMPAKSNTNMGVHVTGSNYFPGATNDNNSANNIRTTTQNIRLPTVPVPSTSVFSSGIISPASSVISSSPQQQNTTQNYMFTSNIQPAHQNNQISSQPNFNMSMVNAKPTTNNVSNSNADLFQQYLNIPK